MDCGKKVFEECKRLPVLDDPSRTTILDQRNSFDAA